MNDSDRLVAQFKATIDAMSDEEFLAAAEQDCPWLFGDNSPPPQDAMFPGPVTAPPSLSEFIHREKKADQQKTAGGKAKNTASDRSSSRRPRAGATVVSASSKNTSSVSRNKKTK